MRSAGCAALRHACLLHGGVKIAKRTVGKTGQAMGRRRTLTRDELFAAVERVVQEHGPLGVTIEAVAREAGVSKATVLYDHASKTDLLLAFMENKIGCHRREVEAYAKGCPDPDRAWFEGLVAGIGNIPGPGPDDTLASMFLSEALKSDNPCRAMLRQLMENDLARLPAACTDSRAGLLAYLAAHGLAMLTLYGSTSFSPDERQQILNDILRLAQSDLAVQDRICASPETKT